MRVYCNMRMNVNFKMINQNNRPKRYKLKMNFFISFTPTPDIN